MPSPEQPDRDTTILFVDDNDLTRFAMRRLLSRRWRVVVAEDAETAIDILEAGLKVDLIVTDYWMPGGGGEEVLRVSRRLVPARPVILLTGLDLVNSGFDAVVRKPVETDRLEELIGTILASMRSDGVG